VSRRLASMPVGNAQSDHTIRQTAWSSDGLLLCVLMPQADTLVLLRVDQNFASGSLAAIETASRSQGKPQALESDGMLWDAAGWLGDWLGGSFLGDSDDGADSPSRHFVAGAVKRHPTKRQRAHLAAAQAAAQLPHAVYPSCSFLPPTFLASDAFRGVSPAHSLHSLHALQGHPHLQALCLTQHVYQGIEKQAALFGIPRGTGEPPVLLGFLPLPASTVVRVYLGPTRALCLVQTGDAPGSTIVLSTTLKSNGCLGSGWEALPQLAGAAGIHIVGGEGSSPHITCTGMLVWYHSTTQLDCFDLVSERDSPILVLRWSQLLQSAAVLVSSSTAPPRPPSLLRRAWLMQPPGQVWGLQMMKGLLSAAERTTHCNGKSFRRVPRRRLQMDPPPTASALWPHSSPHLRHLSPVPTAACCG
jgi:hypothetical protein